MSRVNNENYIVVQGWMVNELKLKGNELLIYALIYGFSQDGEQRFSGSLQYIADWTNSTKAGVMRALKKLVAKGFIHKHDVYVNGVKFCEYYATKLHGVCNKVEQGYDTKLHGGMQQSIHNNISDNISDNININTANYQQIVDMYHSICVSYPKVRSLSDARKRAIKARLKTYSMDEIREVFEKAEASDFMRGANNRNWTANFDWIIKDANMAKILDGNYSNDRTTVRQQKPLNFSDIDF